MIYCGVLMDVLCIFCYFSICSLLCDPNPDDPLVPEIARQESLTTSSLVNPDPDLLNNGSGMI